MHIFDIEIDINIYIDITLFDNKIILRNTQITKSFCDVEKDLAQHNAAASIPRPYFGALLHLVFKTSTPGLFKCLPLIILVMFCESDSQ